MRVVGGGGGGVNESGGGIDSTGLLSFSFLSFSCALAVFSEAWFGERLVTLLNCFLSVEV